MDSTVEVSRGADQVVATAREHARSAGYDWAGYPIKDRLRVIRQVRRLIARDCKNLAALLAHRRSIAETLVSEVLPLAEAARFLERRATALLAPRILRRGRPIWLLGVGAEVRREPLGVVLVIAPSNYPLFLPGVQILQALTAGNAVCVKPAAGCSAPMMRLATLLSEAGLPVGVLSILGESMATGVAAAQAGFDRIVLTGSASTGRQVLHAAAQHLTPTTMELSGNDPVFILPGADLNLVASCLAYGLRLNGGATCIAPRRVFVPEPQARPLETVLLVKLALIDAVKVSDHTLAHLQALLNEASASGARVLSRPDGGYTLPIVVADARSDLRLLRADIFAPVLAIVPVRDMPHAVNAAKNCPYALGASIFGPEPAARVLATKVNAGSVVINDLIVPTADPRLPFGGRGESGFGVTRGAEGLLEMTAVKTISTRRGRFRPHLTPSGPKDATRFAAMIRLLHGGMWSKRWKETEEPD